MYYLIEMRNLLKTDFDINLDILFEMAALIDAFRNIHWSRRESKKKWNFPQIDTHYASLTVIRPNIRVIISLVDQDCFID